jgi:hypothetical protein
MNKYNNLVKLNNNTKEKNNRIVLNNNTKEKNNRIVLNNNSILIFIIIS